MHGVMNTFSHNFFSLSRYSTCGSRSSSRAVLNTMRFHYSAIVIEMLELRGFEHNFLPPYSPFFNGIECMFSSEWKHYVKVAFKDIGQEMKQIFKKEVEHLN